MAVIEAPTSPSFRVIEQPAEPDLRITERHARILSVSSSHFDHAMLRRMIDKSQWRLIAAYNYHEAVQKLQFIDVLIVICEQELPDGIWKDLLETVLRLERPPFLVVTSGIADENLWAEVLNLGGFDVLVKPLREEEVRNVLDSVWLHRVRPARRAPTLRAAS